MDEAKVIMLQRAEKSEAQVRRSLQYAIIHRKQLQMVEDVFHRKQLKMAKEAIKVHKKIAFDCRTALEKLS